MPSEENELQLLQNLLSARGFADDSPDKALWQGLFAFCQAAMDNLAELEEAQDDLSVYIEAIDEDLSALEGRLYGMDEESEDEDPAYLDRDRGHTCPYCHQTLPPPL